jgi:hypothetical protein
MFKKVLVFVMIVLAVGVSISAFADINITDSSGSGVGSSLQKTINWIANVIGLGLVALGVIITGIRFALHDPLALQKSWGVIVGGAIIFAVGKIITLLKFFAQ